MKTKRILDRFVQGIENGFVQAYWIIVERGVFILLIGLSLLFLGIQYVDRFMESLIGPTLVALFCCWLAHLLLPNEWPRWPSDKSDSNEKC